MFPLIILVASALTHFLFFGHPVNVVFDEVHVGYTLSHYWSNTFFFYVHPPFAQLLIAGIGYLIGAQHDAVNWTQIGNALTTNLVLLRLIPNLAGTLLPLIIYWICRRLDMSKLGSFIASLLVCFENSLVVQSRFLLVDMIMLFFGFLAVAAYLEYRHQHQSLRNYSYLLLLTSLFSTGIATSIKWTGLSFFLSIILLEWWERYRGDKNYRRLFRLAGIYIAGIAIVYASSFAVHFSQLKRPGPDNDFVSSGFMNETFPDKFIELNVRMFQTSATLYTPHSYSSKWYTWSLSIRPIFYWQSTSTDKTLPKDTTEYIYYLGNPVIYWLGTAAILVLIVSSVWNLIRRRRGWNQNSTTNAPGSNLTNSNVPATNSRLLFFVLSGFLINFLPFIFIGRVMFLYHYEAALVFSILAIAYVIDNASPRRKLITSLTVLLIALCAFIFFSPLTYGTPLNESALSARMWLASWR